MGHSDQDSGGWRGRLAEMEEQLHALAAELAQDAGEPAPEPLGDPEPAAVAASAPPIAPPPPLADPEPTVPPPPRADPEPAAPPPPGAGAPSPPLSSPPRPPSGPPPPAPTAPPRVAPESTAQAQAPRPAAPRPDPAPVHPPAQPNATLEAMCARLLASMRELMAGYELALTHVGSRPEAGAVTVAAGPFDGLASLERFEAALRGLPQVSAVAVREYEGADRVVLEVRLDGGLA